MSGDVRAEVAEVLGRHRFRSGYRTDEYTWTWVCTCGAGGQVATNDACEPGHRAHVAYALMPLFARLVAECAADLSAALAARSDQGGAS